MRLVLSVVGENAGPLGRDGRKVFGPEGGSLGRGGSSAWRLPDPTNTLSANHAVIAHNGLGFTITDTSTNGVYINTVDAPLGRGNTAALAEGDTLYLADYVISVSVEHDQVEQRQKLGLGSTAMLAGAASRRAELGPASLDLEKPFDDVFGRDNRFGTPAAPPPPPPQPQPQSFLPDTRQAGLAGLPGLNEPWPPAPPAGFGPLDSPATARALGTPGWPDAFPLPAAKPENRSQPLLPEQEPPRNNPLLGPAPAPSAAAPLPGKVIPDDLDFSDLLSGLPRGGAPQAPVAAPAPLMPAAPIPPLAPPPMPQAVPQPIPPAFMAAPPATSPFAPVPDHILAAPLPSAPAPLTAAPAPLQRPALPFDAPPPVEGRAPAPLRPAAPLSPNLANDLVALRDPGSAAPMPGDRVLDPLAVLKQRAAERAAPAPRAPDRRDATMISAMPPGPALQGGPAMPGRDGGDLNAFWTALGVDPQSIPPERRHQVLAELGGALREMAEGLHSVLAARSMLKGEFQVEQTRIQSSGNNAFKFVRSGDEALRKTLANESGFLSLSRAVRDGFHDIKAHEVAAMMAMRAVIGNVLTRVSPPVIETDDTGGGLFGRRTDKAKLWDRFVEMHASMVNDIDRTTRSFIGEEFSRTYDEQVAKLRRGEG